MHSWLSAKHRASLQASGGWARDDEEDGGKALNARQEEDGRQKPIRQPESRVPSFSQLFRPLEDQDTARNECENPFWLKAALGITPLWRKPRFGRLANRWAFGLGAAWVKICGGPESIAMRGPEGTFA